MEIPATSSLLPTPKEIEICLQALEMLPSHLAVVVPTLRLALYSNNYAGVLYKMLVYCIICWSKLLYNAGLYNMLG